MKLSLLSVLLGAGMALPQIFGLTRPAQLASAAKRFPRNLPVGILLMLLGTAWFVWNVSIEPIADFASFKPYMMVGFVAVGLLSCVFVQDYLAVRGLAVVLLLLGKCMGGCRPAPSRPVALRPCHPNLGLRVRPRGHLADHRPLAPARPVELGHGHRIPHPAPVRRAAGLRRLHPHSGPDGVPLHVTRHEPVRFPRGLPAGALERSGLAANPLRQFEAWFQAAAGDTAQSRWRENRHRPLQGSGAPSAITAPRTATP